MAKGGYSTLPIEDFSGGWNPRDAWSQIADNESPECLNVTMDERGGVAKRLGLTKTGAQTVNTGNVQQLYYSQSLDQVMAQVGNALYYSTDGGATWTDTTGAFSSSARLGMVDFLDKLVVIHPADACFTWDGSAWAGPIANSPKGNAIAAWQNHLWSCGDPTTGATQRVQRSDPGAHTWAATPVYVDLRYKDDQPLTAIGGGVGMDEVGRGGILVFKEASTYRIHDTQTLDNTIVDYSYGASGPLSIITNRGITAAISRKGIVGTRGEGGAVTVLSDKIQPLFLPTQMEYVESADFAAGAYRDRMVFSLAWNDSTENNLTLEYDPVSGWFVPHDFGCAAFTSYTKNTELLYGAKVGTDSSSYGYVLKVFNGATDDGTNINARWQSRWFSPFASSEVRFRRCIVNGRGVFNLYVKRNYDTGQGDLFPITLTGSGGVWGSMLWGTDTWGVNLQQDMQEIFSLGHGRAISFEIQDATDEVMLTPPFLDVGTQETTGAFALYGLNLDMVPLGRLVTTISTTDVSNGTVADAAEINSNFAAVRSVVNGSIDNANISSSAAVVPSKLSPGSEGHFLQVVGGQAAWAAGPAAGAGLPTGSVVPYAGSTAPSGFLFCEGQAVSRSGYAALFAICGTAYGAGNGTTTFNVPDLQGRMAVGKGTHADVDALGDSDGESTVGNRRAGHKHTVNDPWHAHNYTAPSGSIGAAGGGLGAVNTSGGAVTDYQPTGITVGPQTNSTTDAPAYLVLNMMIKT